MVVTCEECLTRFNLDESILKKTGSKVRCCQCKHVFTVYPPPMENHEPEPFIFPLDMEEKTTIGEKEKNFELAAGMDGGPDKSAQKRESGYSMENDQFEMDNDLEFDEGLDLDDNLEFDDGLQFDIEEESELDIPDQERPVERAKDGTSEFDLELDVDLDMNLEMTAAKPKVNPPTLENLEPDEEINLSEFDEALESQKDLFSELSQDNELKTDLPKEPHGAGINPKSQINGDEDENKGSLSSEHRATKEETLEETLSLDYGIKEEFKKPVNVAKPVLIILFLAILLLGGYSTCIMYNIEIPYISTIRIPFLSDYLKPLPPPPIPIRLAPEKKSVTGRFVTNTVAGTLFVITGNVINTSEVVCNHIKIKGTLITKDNVKAKDKTVYCGNIISEEDLKAMEMAAIETLLLKETGNNLSNVSIKPGQSVPFMIVFSDLPPNLENFTVNVADFEKEIPTE